MKTDTRNEYEKAVNKAIDYINMHLYDKISLQTLSQEVNVSEYHFHRIFKEIVKENVGEFVARLRLEDIAQRLRMSNDSLTKIAYEKGYSSKHALSKAFKNHFGMSPTVYRSRSTDIGFFTRNRKVSPLVLHPELRTIEAKNLIYIRIIDMYGAFEAYDQAWQKLIQFGHKHRILNEQTEFIGLSFDDPTITQAVKCRFYACITAPETLKPTNEFGVQKLDGGLYAVFTLKGSYSGLLNLYYNIYINWLPNSGYRLRRMYAFEKYLNNPMQSAEEDLLTEIYVPIKAVR